MTESIKGTCEGFCPKTEYLLRTKENLLHFYELKNGKKNVPGILVKSFSRSAAGCNSQKKTDLRTERSLRKTIEYLLKAIVFDERKPFSCNYEFIFDRLRAVRQEIVIQNYDAASSIKILEPIVMFLSYSRYRLCEEHIHNFDPVICETHLQECLKRILCCYDVIRSDSNCNDSIQQDVCKNQHFIESLYQIFNLGSGTALCRGLTLPDKIRNSKIFQLSFSISLNYFSNNYYKTFRGIEKLPHILCAIASLKLPHIRKKMLAIFSKSYNSKELCVPIAWLKNLLIYSSSEELFTDCEHFCIEIVEKADGVRFSKLKFLEQKEPPNSKREPFVEAKFKDINLSTILLLANLE